MAMITQLQVTIYGCINGFVLQVGERYQQHQSSTGIKIHIKGWQFLKRLQDALQ